MIGSEWAGVGQPLPQQPAELIIIFFITEPSRNGTEGVVEGIAPPVAAGSSGRAASIIPGSAPAIASVAALATSLLYLLNAIASRRK